MNYCIVDNWRSNTATNMWHIYIVFAVLFRGAYCNPLINTTEHSPCIVVIKRFGEQVKTLEVQWNSTIYLICDVSCVGPRPQLGLTWLYRDKNRSKLINIEKLFRSPKFETYPANFHRKNELVIRDFGPNEETDFICKGAIKKQRMEAKVALTGTDCLLKYNFRCKLGKKCIDRAYLCNQHKECPDGEDEVGCAERPTVRVEPEKITVPMGTTGILHCIVTGVPAPTITWLKSRQELSTNHQIDGNILRITQATMDDRGIYVCRAENIAGSDEDWGIVEVERRIRPKIDLYPDGTQTVSVGGNAFFQCRVIDGDPPLKVTWSRVGGLQLTERTEVMDNGEIMFKGTTQEEHGFYVCTVSNDMGTTNEFAKLIVQGPPTIVIQPSKMINAIVGQRVRMECIAQGEPIPSVYWINPLVPRLGDIVPQAGFPQKEGTAIFEITNVGKENTGFYTCVAQNAGGITEDRVQLIVEEGQRAEVKIAGPETLSVVDGGSVELTCSASAILSPLIRWRRREGPLPIGHSLRGGILSIPRLTVEYGGEYICSTSSSKGSYQASVFIIVTGKFCEFRCRNGTCISSTKQCDGIPDCPDGDDEICGAYCIVVIKRFGEQVETLEVQWNSDIHLICDTSCVGPRPQLGLTWFYRDKNQSKDINIEKLFRSPKFQTYPASFHQKNELVIRDFGPNEETDFICKGAIKKQSLEAKVALTGTDCLLKYNFRCKLGNKCIDRAYLCNQHNECPDGEDEVGCGKNMNATTTLATTRIPEKGVVTKDTPEKIDYIDMTTTVSATLMPETDVETKQTSKESILPVTILSFRDGSESTSFSLLWRASQPTGIQITGFRVQYSEVSIRPDRTPDGNYQVDKTIGPYRVVELPSGADRFTIVGLQPGRYYEAVVFATESSKQSSQNSFIFKTADAPVCSVSEFQCKSGTCIDLARKCDGFPDCPDDSDEVVDCFISECLQDEFQCQNLQCVSAGQRCDRQSQCTDGSDEINCTCPVNTFQCRQTNILECIGNKLHCDGTPDCTDGSDEEGCTCAKDFFRCNDGNCVPDRLRCDGIPQCEDGSDEIQCATVICLSDEFWCVNQRKCLSIAFRCNGILDCEDGSDEAECELPLICSEGKKVCKDLSKCIDDSQLCNGVQDCTDGGDEKDCGLEKKKITVGTVINDDGDNDLLSTTDGVTDNNGEFTDTTTPFDYDLYAY